MSNSMQARVTRLRQIIADAVPDTTARSPQESDAWQRYQAFAANQPYPSFDISARGRETRAINRIAVTYGWVGEIQRFLDDRMAPSIAALDDETVTELFERMRTLEACVQEGCDPPDMPPAR